MLSFRTGSETNKLSKTEKQMMKNEFFAKNEKKPKKDKIDMDELLKGENEEQKRILENQIFMRSLNKQKTFFANIEKEIIPIVEGPEEDEFSIVSVAENVAEQTIDNIQSEPSSPTKLDAVASPQNQLQTIQGNFKIIFLI